MSTSIPKILGKLYGFPKKFEKSRASLGKNFEILRRPSIQTDILPKYSVGCPCKQIVNVHDYSLKDDEIFSHQRIVIIYLNILLFCILCLQGHQEKIFDA